MDPNPASSTHSLPPLDAATPEEVSQRFAELRSRFDIEVSGASDETSWKTLRDAWAGRKAGVLVQITDTWLKPAKPELKRSVGQSLNELKGHLSLIHI